MRSLILRGGALGDFLVTLPLLEALSLRYPQGRVELIGNKTAASLAIEAGLLSAAHNQNDARWLPLFTGEPLPIALAGWLGSFDLVVSFSPDPDGAMAEALRTAIKGQFIVGRPHPTQGPAAQHYLSACSSLGLPDVPLVTRLRRSAGPAQGIAIHPGSGSAAKNWPRERWEAVSEALARESSVATILGPADRGDALPGSSEVWRDLPLPTLADKLAGCRLYLGNDSGISHLAACCGVPSVLLFGPSDPSMWAPPVPTASVLPAASEVSSERVLAAARRFLQAAG